MLKSLPVAFIIIEEPNCLSFVGILPEPPPAKAPIAIAFAG